MEEKDCMNKYLISLNLTAKNLLEQDTTILPATIDTITLLSIDNKYSNLFTYL